MKNLIIAILMIVALSAISYAQTQTGLIVSSSYLRPSGRTDTVLLEFNPISGTPSLTAGGTQKLLTGIAAELRKREAGDPVPPSPSDLTQGSRGTAIRGLYRDLLGRPVDPATAVKIGKLLGVNYALIGTTQYDDARGAGTFTVKAQLVDVETGRVAWSHETNAAGITKTGAGRLEIAPNVLKTLIQKLTASLKAADL